MFRRFGLSVVAMLATLVIMFAAWSPERTHSPPAPSELTASVENAILLQPVIVDEPAASDASFRIVPFEPAELKRQRRADLRVGDHVTPFPTMSGVPVHVYGSPHSRYRATASRAVILNRRT